MHATVETTQPSLAALEAWLEAQPREIVEHFAFAYAAAASELVDYSAGVQVDGIVWSEDSTEDLCNSGCWPGLCIVALGGRRYVVTGGRR